MEKLCSCGSPLPEVGPHVSSFVHPDLFVVTYKVWDGQCKKCAKEASRRKFDKLNKPQSQVPDAQPFLMVNKNSITINWDEYRWRKDIDDDTDSCVELLLMVSLLSHNPEDAWDIVDSACTSIGPIDDTGALYFARRDDARDYANKVIGKTMYQIRIQHIDVVEYIKH